MEMDLENLARLLGAICRQAIHDHQAGDAGATPFLWEAGLLRPDGSLGRSTVETLPDACPPELCQPRKVELYDTQPRHPRPKEIR
jgi:hypothetical protein